MDISLSKWFITSDHIESENMSRLFCFPYSGGGASIYHKWSKCLPADIAISALQLPGHESRIAENLITDLNLLIEILVNEIKPYINKPYVFFGHSLGALISFELARKLRKMNLPLPKCLIVSGRAAPHTPSKNGIIHNLAHHEFIAKLKEYNGLPEAILQNQELLSLFLPIIRADFKLSEDHKYIEDDPLPIPIIALIGQEDSNVVIENVALWQKHTTKNFEEYVLPGDHFFIKSEFKTILNIIKDAVKTFEI